MVRAATEVHEDEVDVEEDAVSCYLSARLVLYCTNKVLTLCHLECITDEQDGEEYGEHTS